MYFGIYSKTWLKLPLSKRQKIGFQDQSLLNAGQRIAEYRKLFFKTNYRLMQVKSIAECSKRSILKYFIPSFSYHFAIKIFVLSIFAWLFYTGFTVLNKLGKRDKMQGLPSILSFFVFFFAVSLQEYEF